MRYLEVDLVRLAKEAHRCELDNGDQPQRPSPSAADEADVQTFLDEMLLCFPVLGVSVFEKPVGTVPKKDQMYLKAKDCGCCGYEWADGSVVLKGSRARVHEVPSIHAYLTDPSATPVATGVPEQDGDTYVLTRDYELRSPSCASVAMEGRTSNGRVEWHDKDGRTLKELQTEAAADAVRDSDDSGRRTPASIAHRAVESLRWRDGDGLSQEELA